MGYDLTVQGLIRKRAELAGTAESLRDQLDARLSELDAIDRTIRVFKPDIDLADLPSRAAPPALTGTRGEFQRFLLDALRKANGPQSTLDLARIVMEARGMNQADKVLAKLISERTGNALAKMRRAGKLFSRRVGKSTLLEWQISPFG
jgi:hypothetical protein